MRLFLANFNGVWLGGQALIVAETKRKAFNDLKKLLKYENLYEKNKDISIDCLVEINTNERSAYLIDNGDY